MIQSIKAFKVDNTGYIHVKLYLAIQAEVVQRKAEKQQKPWTLTLMRGTGPSQRVTEIPFKARKLSYPLAFILSGKRRRQLLKIHLLETQGVTAYTDQKIRELLYLMEHHLPHTHLLSRTKERNVCKVERGWGALRALLSQQRRSPPPQPPEPGNTLNVRVYLNLK